MQQYNIDLKGYLTNDSSGGKLLKFKVGDKFIKTSTIGQDMYSLQPKFLYESYSEIIAYYIGKCLGYSMLKYSLCEVSILNNTADLPDKAIACVSKDFTLFDGQRYEYVSIAKLMLEGTIPFYPMQQISSYYSIIKEIYCVKNFQDYLNKQILLDYIIMNDDRHLGNFGLLRDKANNTYKLPPIFDNGNSLFANKYIENLEYSTDLFGYIKSKPFHFDFETQIKLIDIKRYYKPKENIIKTVEKILSTLVKDYRLPEQRAYFIDRLLKDRLYNLETTLYR